MTEAWILENAETLQFVLFFTLLAVFGIVEAIEPARSPRHGRRERWLTNFTLTGLNIVVMSLLPVTYFGLAVAAAERGIGALRPLELPGLAFVLVHLLGRGLISFLSHFLMHRVPWLWRFHRVHHLDTEMDVSTTVRFHPVEFVVNLLIGGPVVVLLGLSPWVLLFYEVLDAGVTLFSHANVSLPRRIERVLRYLLVTPDLHRVHHSSHQPETDSNFGAVFPVWDLVFGTFRTAEPERQREMELGLEQIRDGRTRRLGWLLASPWRRDEGPAAAQGARGERS